ncbi:MAG: diacylglycerol kinase [Nitrospiraceae bacterium]|nr:diacylglycerol kinase [Nitrospiraceae bacterium]
MKPTTWTESANLAIEGIIYSVKTQRHMRYHLYAALIALVLSLVLDISRTEFILLCMAIVLVLTMEMLNTAIETTVDMISVEYHPLAKIAKDIAAGVVLIASIGALTLGYLILYPALKNTVLYGHWHIRKAPHDVIAFVSLAVVIILVIIIKAFVGKGEPLRGGMPSGHAAVSFSIWAAAFFLADSPAIIVLTFVLAVMVSWSRWQFGIHKPLEVLAGALIGSSVTFLFFMIFS